MAALAHLGPPEQVWEAVQTLEQLGLVKVIRRRQETGTEVPTEFGLMIGQQGMVGLIGLATGKIAPH